MPEISEFELNRLKSAVGELATLNQIANAINLTMSVDKITGIIVENCRRRVKASQGAIFLLDNDEQQMDRFTTFVREFSTDESSVPFHLNQSLQGWMLKNRSILLSNQPDSDDRLKGVNFASLGLKSLVAAPLISRRGLIGILVLFNREGGGDFEDQDARFLGIVGTQVAKVIENARLFERERQLAEIEKEIDVAKRIQSGFLPKENIADDRYDLFGVNVPAREVGGDYYDFISLPNDQLFLSLGDISGKGLPAALLMTNAQAVPRSLLHLSKTVNLPELAGCLNQLFYHFSAPEQYTTTLFGVYDHSSGVFSYINAGHIPPLVLRANGTIEKPSEADLVIGVMPDVSFAVHQLSLGPNDCLLLYTDGITDAVNTDMHMFGDDNFEQELLANVGKSAEELCTAVQQKIIEFRGRAEQFDDITLLALKIH